MSAIHLKADIGLLTRFSTRTAGWRLTGP